MTYQRNPDKEYADEVAKRIKKNSGYCLSASERNKDTKCPCRKFRKTEHGWCDCGLYIK